jgi:gliding motility-associated-like protein
MMLKLNILNRNTYLIYQFTLLFVIFPSLLYGQNCTVNAGGNSIVCGDSTTLVGTLNGVSIPGTINWTFISGPGPLPTIVSPNSLVTDVTGMTMDGIYTFQLSSNCGSGISVDLVSVTAHPQPLSFTAGPDVSGICATVGTTTLNGNIPAGFSGSWSAFNIYYWNRFGDEVSTNAQFSNATIQNPDFSLIQTADHTIDPAYYGVLEITSLDGICTYTDTTQIEFCPNPAIIPPASYTICGLGDIYFYLEPNSPMLASNSNYEGAGSDPAVIYTINEISKPAGAGTLTLNEIEGAYVDMSGFTVEGIYVISITIESPCCGGPVTTAAITLDVHLDAPLNLDFNPGGVHPEQLSLYSWGNSAGEVHCGITNVATPELFYFDINAADLPSTVTSVNFSGPLPTGASTPTVLESGSGTMSRVISVDPGVSGWKVGTYEFRINVGISPCQSVASYFIHISDGNRPEIEVRDTSLCYPGSGVMSAEIIQPEIFQEQVDPTYFQQFNGSWSYAVVSKPIGSGTPIFDGVSDRELVDPTTTISNLTLPGDYVFTIKPFNGNGVGDFLQAEYACSGISGPLVDTFTVHIENKINANAGSDQALGCTSSIFLLGNSPGTGVGLWSSVSSPAGASPIISEPNEPSTVPTELTVAGAYTFNWNIMSQYGACVSNDAITFTISAVSPNAPTFNDPSDITQPSCTVATGSVLLGGLPASGSWDLIASPGGMAISGSGTSVLFSGLSEGDYTFVVDDGTCTSLPSDTVHILAQPPTPDAPLIADISYCLNESSSNLTATPDLNCTLNWYGMNAIGGTASSTGPNPSTLVAGVYTYYVSQTNADLCESSRATLNVTINDPLPPTGNGSQSFCQIDNPTIADLVLNEVSIAWYSNPGGSLLLETTALIDGTHYYATQTENGCESSTYIDVLVTVFDPAAPSGNGSPVYCIQDSLTVGELITNGTNVNWYDAAGGGSLIDPSALLVDGMHYYATETVSGCESTSFLDVLVTINSTLNPIGDTNQSFCVRDNAIVSDLVISGQTVQWYDAPLGGTLLASSTLLQDGVHYYASQTIDGCESISLQEVLVTILNPLAPNGNQSPIFCTSDSPQISDLTPSGSDILWYSDNNLLNSLSTAEELQDTTHYYATQVIDNCEGVQFLDVFVSLLQTPGIPLLSKDTSYCFHEELFPMTIQNGNNGNFTWYSDENLTDSIGFGLSFLPFDELGTTSYYVVEKNGNCASPSNAVRIVIQECSFLIPTAFTPDNDLTNDVWVLEGIDQMYERNIVRIYNRWGSLLYTSPEGAYEQNSWDGTFNGEKLPVASYYFIIDFNDGKRPSETGTVSIINNK